MPAVTVPDVTVLPRVPEPGESAVERGVRSVTTAPTGFEGEGFPVRRAFAGVDLRDLDPFLMMDQMGEVEYAPGEPKGTYWHPHRGFETVTYIMDGTFEHQDSHGGGGVITNGDTQWMTAGSGLLHIERPPESLVVSGGLFHGLQLWVNLPKADKWLEPKYQDLRGGEAALLTSHDGGALIRLIAGELGGHLGPGTTFTPMTMAHATVSPGASVRLPWRRDFNALVYVLSGTGTVGADRRPVRTGQAVLFGAGDAITVAADATQESRLAGPGRGDPRRPADPRADRLGGPVRDEHQGRGADGVRGLPEGQARRGARHVRAPRRGRADDRASDRRVVADAPERSPVRDHAWTARSPGFAAVPARARAGSRSCTPRSTTPTPGRASAGSWPGPRWTTCAAAASRCGRTARSSRAGSRSTPTTPTWWPDRPVATPTTAVAELATRRREIGDSPP